MLRYLNLQILDKTAKADLPLLIRQSGDIKLNAPVSRSNTTKVNKMNNTVIVLPVNTNVKGSTTR